MKKTILIVDDDAVTRAWLTKQLEQPDREIRTVATGSEALQVARTQAPDLILLDLILPDMDGLEVCRALRRDPLTASVNIIVLSTRSGVDDVVAALDAGADDYIAKSPTAIGRLQNKIEALWSHAAKLESQPHGQGRIVSFLAAKGGIGTTSICVNLAYAFAELVQPRKIVVADMVLPLGAIGRTVGIQRGDSILQALTDRQTIPDEQLVKRYGHTLDHWPFSILLGADDLREAQSVEFTQITPLFNTLRTMFDFIFADFGRSLSRISLPILRSSQCIVLIMASDVVTLDLTRAYLDYLTSPEIGIPRERFLLVFNRAVGRAGLELPEIEERLKLSAAGTIPYSEDCFTDAANRGRPLAQLFPYHVSVIILRELAQKLHRQLETVL